MLDVADDRLPALVDVDVLDGDLLLALAAMAVQGFEQRGVGAGEPVRLVQVLAAALERLLAEHGAPVAFHRGVVAGEELGGNHPLKLVLRADADQGSHRGAVLPVVSSLRRSV